MATLLQFSRNIRKRGSQIENASLALTKKVAKTALRELVEGTPVDTGKARSNWRVSIGNRTRAEIPPHVPGRKLGINEKQNARVAIQLGIAKINELRIGKKSGSGQAGSALFITNAIPYLTKLRNGYSKQQPNDWVEIALIRAQSVIQQTRLLQPGSDDEGDL